jgi:hypothetical protein
MVDSSDVIFIPRFVKVGHVVQNMKGAHTHTQTSSLI